MRISVACRRTHRRADRADRAAVGTGVGSRPARDALTAVAVHGDGAGEACSTREGTCGAGDRALPLPQSSYRARFSCSLIVITRDSPGGTRRRQRWPLCRRRSPARTTSSWTKPRPLCADPVGRPCTEEGPCHCPQSPVARLRACRPIMLNSYLRVRMAYTPRCR